MKPVPPPDLWARLAEMIPIEGGLDKPANGFTRVEFSERLGYKMGTAIRRLNALIAQGKVKRVNHKWYVLVEE